METTKKQIQKNCQRNKNTKMATIVITTKTQYGTRTNRKHYRMRKYNVTTLCIPSIVDTFCSRHNTSRIKAKMC